MSCLTLCLLAKERKLSQFKNYAFNSFANIHGNLIGASDTGLYKVVTSDLDGTAHIGAELTLASTDFGIHNPKKIRRVYLGFYSESDLEVTVSADKVDPETYTVPVDENGLGRGCVTIKQNMRGKYWTIKINNTGGGYFALDTVDVLLIPFSEGRRT
jgi:hypothetical protein